MVAILDLKKKRFHFRIVDSHWSIMFDTAKSRWSIICAYILRRKSLVSTDTVCNHFAR